MFNSLEQLLFSIIGVAILFYFDNYPQLAI
ncbi:hypothetical protein C8R34_10142 [Nitrosomonas sp. Nm84]|nr:hypothetical protein C8R34_10142 [Nitrosomonas sp. Nm84]